MMQLTGDLAACRNHAQIVRYPLSVPRDDDDDGGDDGGANPRQPQQQLHFTLHQRFSCETIGGCTWRGSALLARLLLCPPVMAHLLAQHRSQTRRAGAVVATIGGGDGDSSATAAATRRGMSCIELGSGTGLVALAAAASLLFGYICATEIDEPIIQGLLKRNLELNRAGVLTELCGAVRGGSGGGRPVPTLTSMRLNWGQMDLPASDYAAVTDSGTRVYDVVLASEVLYDPELVDPLIATLLALTWQCSRVTGLHPTTLLTNDTRDGDAAQMFMTRAAKYFVIDRMAPSLVAAFAPDWLPWKSPEEGVFVLQRRPEICDHRTQMARFRRAAPS